MKKNENEQSIEKTELLSDYNDVLKFNEMLEALRIGRNKGYELLRKNVIVAKRIGNNYRIPKINVINYLLNH